MITFDFPNNSLFQLSKCFSEHIHFRFGKRSHVGSKGNDNEAMLSWGTYKFLQLWGKRLGCFDIQSPNHDLT